jgi:hypothetical protein
MATIDVRQWRRNVGRCRCHRCGCCYRRIHHGPVAIRNECDAIHRRALILFSPSFFYK